MIAGWITVAATFGVAGYCSRLLYQTARWPWSWQRPVPVPKQAVEMTMSSGSDFVGFV